MTSSKQLQGNHPEKVDTLMGGAILFAFGLVVGLVFFMNIGPYRGLVYNALFSWGWLAWLFTIPLLGALLTKGGNVLSAILGAALFAGIQLAEVWPLVSSESEKERKSGEWGAAMRFRVGLACVAYALDALACSVFWPPLKVPFEQFRWAALLSDIHWVNLGVTLITLFGLAAYVWLWRKIARIM